MPVWEEEQLGNYSRQYPPSMPFHQPTGPSEYNGMYLDIDAGGDTLVGRAANGGTQSFFCCSMPGTVFYYNKTPFLLS